MDLKKRSKRFCQTAAVQNLRAAHHSLYVYLIGNYAYKFYFHARAGYPFSRSASQQGNGAMKTTLTSMTRARD